MTTQMTDMQAMASLFRKKASVMAALEGGMVKTGENTHFKYKYVTASRIKHAVSRLLFDNGLSLQMSGLNTDMSVSVVEKKDGGTKEVPILRIQFQITLCDLDTGATESSFWFGEAQATDDKAASKCATSALKYYLISNLMIADKDEDKRDTDNQKRRPVETQAAPVQHRPTDSKPSSPAQPPTTSTTAHWSTDDAMMGKMYAWAEKENASRDDVNAAIAAAGKVLSNLTRDEVKLIVIESLKNRIPF